VWNWQFGVAMSSKSNLPIGRDVGIWLSTKLEEPWSSEKIVSFLTPELLDSIKPKWLSLEPSVKLKLLFAFVILRKRSVTELAAEINQIIELGLEDDDDWVRVISEMLKNLTNEIPTIELNINNEYFTKSRDHFLNICKYPLHQHLVSTSVRECMQLLHCVYVSVSSDCSALCTFNDACFSLHNRLCSTKHTTELFTSGMCTHEQTLTTKSLAFCTHRCAICGNIRH
jgi:hypothetical protein